MNLWMILRNIWNDVFIGYSHFFMVHMKQNYIELLPITMPHLNTLIKLPFHHRDPFDRLIISQSLFESISIISIDEKFDKYDINRIW
jgi:PIN domain nuclease of toxin-antitoxin system